jgi:hypothetical protein
MKKFLYLFLFVLLTSAFLISCQKESITDEISSIGKNEGVSPEGYVKTEILDEAAIAEINAKADAEFIRFKKSGSHLKSTIPHWVGVIANSTSCPSGVAEIRYFMDCEDSRPVTKYRYNNTGCFKPGGLSLSGSNLYWVVCIVDANQYNFDNINKGYAIFDLSHIQYLRNAAEVFINSDDEDNDNSNRFDSPSYGFTRNSASPYYPTQTLLKNTNFWFYYFKAENNSLKLPDLGFDYSVFSQFDCCIWTNQNVLQADNEDDRPSNSMRVYPENATPYNAHTLDETYRIFEVNGNINYFVQNSAVYRY